MVKCATCSKVLNTKSPGIQCLKCSKWYHCSCVSITADQLTTLYQTESAEWKCRKCTNTGTSKPKRLSFVLPEEQNNEEEDHEPEKMNDLMTQPNIKSLFDDMLMKVRKEIGTIVSQELQKSLHFYSDKIDDFEKKIVEYDNKLKAADNKYINLENKFKNLELRNEVIEQKLNSIQQDKIANDIEICGIEEKEGENVEEIANQICAELQQKPDDIISVYRKDTHRKLPDNQHKSSPVIKVSLKPGCKDKWLKSFKQLKLQNNT
ncbi:hypothetical protein O0L34_g8226 [Tuta absoluta]|nr:hypothetical protein O0L34_g8226 [Tuta absoluta]